MGIQPDGTLAVGSDNGNLVSIVDCQVGVYKNEYVGDGFGEGEGWGEEGPCVGICVKDYYEERGCWPWEIISLGLGLKRRRKRERRNLRICLHGDLYHLHRPSWCSRWTRHGILKEPMPSWSFNIRAGSSSSFVVMPTPRCPSYMPMKSFLCWFLPKHKAAFF